MALVKCPECGKEVSDTADVCIHCGYRLKEENTELIELTSKKLKKQKLIAMILFFLSAMSIVFSMTNPTAIIIEAIIAFGALVWLIVVELKIWWKHK